MMVLKNFIIRQKNGIFILILLLSIFLRFYKAADFFVFSADEEHQLSISQTIVDNFHLEWVGVSSADTGFYLGPFWQYFGALWLYFSQGNPEIAAYVASTIGVATTILVYLVGKTLFGRKIGLISSLLYATLPLLVFYDRKFWNPAPTAFVSLALLLSLYLTNKDKRWWLAVAGFYAFVFHVHLSLAPLGLIIAYRLWKEVKQIPKKLLVMSLLVFVLIISPLIGFDYFQHGQNLKTPLRVLTAVRENSDRLNLSRNSQQFFRSMGRLWYLYPRRSNADEVLHDCSPYFNNKELHEKGLTTTFSDGLVVLSLFSILLLLWFLFRKDNWKKDNTKILGLFLLVIIISYLILPNTPLEYYLLGVFPLFLFLPSLFLEKLRSKKVKTVFLSGLIFLAVLGVMTVTSATEEYGLAVKRELISRVTKFIGNSVYELDAQGLCHKYEGWRFLFKAYGKAPSKSYTDSMFGWLYQDELVKKNIKYRVLVNEKRIGFPVPEGYVKVIESGGFTAYIYEN